MPLSWKEDTGVQFTSPTWLTKASITPTSTVVYHLVRLPIRGAIRSWRRCIPLIRHTFTSSCGRTARVYIISPGAFPSIWSPPRDTAVPAKGTKSKKARLTEWITEKRPVAVTEADWRELLELLAPVSESYLRHLLRDTEIAVEQPFGGVRQKNLDELQQSLLEMEAVYTRAKAGGDRGRAQLCRTSVIQAKDHARLASRSSRIDAEKKALKEEMVEWMLVWLENPGVFPAWVKLRRSKLEGNA